MMYLIALCDDEPEELEKTEKLLDDYAKKHPGLDFTVRRFENAENLLCEVRKKKYLPDLIFLDIYMPGGQREGSPAGFPTGMGAAQELRSMEYKGKLVFLTTSKEHALEAFDVDASQYLVKPVSEDKWFLALDGLLKDIEAKRKKFILLRTEGRLVRVPLGDIVYCEAQGKTQWMYLADGTQYLLRMTMGEIYGLLSDCREFVRVGAAFIVNLGYIDSINARKIHMENGRDIYLPRGAYKSLRELYFSYYCGERGAGDEKDMGIF